MKNGKYYSYPLIGEAGCVRLSFANAFVELGDFKMAKKVYRNFTKHPLSVGQGKAFPYVFTRLMEDLTDGEYSGQFYFNFSKEDFLGSVPENIEKIVLEEDKKMSFIYDADFENFYDSHFIYSVLMRDGSAHTFFRRDDGVIIDNGVERDRFYLRDKIVLGIMRVNKS